MLLFVFFFLFRVFVVYIFATSSSANIILYQQTKVKFNDCTEDPSHIVIVVSISKQMIDILLFFHNAWRDANRYQAPAFSAAAVYWQFVLVRLPNLTCEQLIFWKFFGENSKNRFYLLWYEILKTEIILQEKLSFKISIGTFIFHWFSSTFV